MDKFLQIFLNNNNSFKFISNLGGETYKLVNKKNDKDYVPKTLVKREDYPGNIEMFTKRFTHIHSINSHVSLPHLEIGSTKKQFYKIYPFYEVTLLDLINEKQLTAFESIALIEKILLALNDFHKDKIVHGNLKPSNIFIAKEDKVIFSDFSYENSPSASHYLMPKYSNKSLKISYDIYAVGVMFFELLNWGESSGNLEKAIHIPGNLYSIVEKACLIKRETRFLGVTEMLESLKKAYRNDRKIIEIIEQPSKQEEVIDIKTKRILYLKSFVFYFILYLFVLLIILYIYFSS